MQSAAETSSAAIATDLFCPECGYNLRGSSGARCPECGRAYDVAKLSASRIPWTSRQQIGRVRAFTRTVWTATAHPRRIAESLQADLALRDARVFVLLSMAPVCAVLTGALLVLRQAGALWSVIQHVTKGTGSGWIVELLYPLDRGLSLLPVSVGIAVLLSWTLGVLPARAALFARYPEALRQRVLAGMHYLSGAILGGAAAGVVAGVVFTMILMLANLGRRGLWGRHVAEAMCGILALSIPVTALFVWANAWNVVRRAARELAPGSAVPLLVIPPVLLLLQVVIWLLVVPWCIGLLAIAAGTLLG